MNAYQSMKSKLLPLGIYAFAAGGAADCELKAYACELDRLYGEINALYREGFIETAETYGLSERERFTGKVRDSLSIAERRALLMDDAQHYRGGSDAAALERILARIGVTDVLVESEPMASKLSVYIYNQLEPWQDATLRRLIRDFAPVTFRLNIQT